MRTFLTAAAVAALLSPTAALAIANPILVTLTDNGSRFGTATLFQSGDDVLVNMESADTHLEGLRVEIDLGACGQLQGVQTELSTTVNGQSQTRVPSTHLTGLADRPHAIVVRKKAWGPVLACGNIKG